MTVFVERNGGLVIGVYAYNCPGIAEEELADDHPDVAAFLKPSQSTPEEISDRQFFQELANRSVITQQEALAAVATGTIPSAMLALINQLPEEQRFPAQMLISGATVFKRLHPVSAMIGGFYGWAGEQIDDLWSAAALL
ncbi:hypothetical protein HGP14_33670 [Rhizobium sp. P32RR-XVIII]|uniref:hypothetical protein n=1 Tax=Rhizobium sp. P32RR-XVIII TaxID=2726738 RepID=UPI001456835F|nr:hypothetical protein [Rhizobium sp. P32RR-XVIII]NLS08146.1 hypothetical protein [Rhizobium sp. P32RR-XVIII]